MASNMGEPKKKTDTELIVFICAAVFAVMLCTWAGYVLEMTASPKKGIQWLEAMESLSEYANPISFIKAFGAVFTGNGITKKGMLQALWSVCSLYCTNSPAAESVITAKVLNTAPQGGEISRRRILSQIQMIFTITS